MRSLSVATVWIVATLAGFGAAALGAQPRAAVDTVRPDTTRAHIAARIAALWPALAVPAVPTRTNVPRGRDAADTLPSSVATGVVWTRDGRGFFYTSVTHPDQLYYHRVRRPGDRDPLIYQSPDGAGAAVRATLSGAGQYLVITATHPGDRHTRLAFIDLSDADHPTVTAPPVKLFDDLDAWYEFAGNAGPTFYVWTDRDGPRGSVLAINSDDPRASLTRTVIPESQSPIVAARVAAGRLVVHYVEDAHSVLRMFGYSGLPLGAVPLPGYGTVGAIVGGGQRGADSIYYAFQSVATAPAVYVFAIKTGMTTVVHPPAATVDSAGYETRLLYYSAGGTPRVPAFITMARGAALDGTRPAWVDPAADSTSPRAVLPLRFSPVAATWLELGGVYAVPLPGRPGAAAELAAFLVAQHYARADGVLNAPAPPPSAGEDGASDWLSRVARLAWTPGQALRLE